MQRSDPDRRSGGPNGSPAAPSGSAPALAPLWSREAEEALLGAVLLDETIWPDVAARVHAEDLFAEAHAILWRTFGDLAAAGATIEPIGVFERLKGSGLLERAGGTEKLLALADAAAVPSGAPAYARIVLEHAALRGMVRACATITEEAHSGEVSDVPDFLSRAEAQVFGIRDRLRRGRPPMRPIPALIDDALGRLRERKARPEAIASGLPTGLADLDRLLGGLKAGHLVILAARPSMGKTSLALNIGRNAAEASGRAVAVFSLETAPDDLADRLLCAEARVSSESYARGETDLEDDRRLAEARETLRALPIAIEDAAGITPLQIRARARRTPDLGLVIVDYLQLVEPDGASARRRDNREQEVAAMSRGFKALARELSVPVLCLSQLNRDLERTERKNKRPQLSDLRDSGSIEQDADEVLFIYREEVYNPGAKEKGVAEINVAKHRNGPIGSVRTRFRPEWTLFESAGETPF